MAADAASKKIRTSSGKWVWTRRGVQTFSLLVFLYLLLITVQGVTGRLPSDLFLHLDPLNGITSMLASRSWFWR